MSEHASARLRSWIAPTLAFLLAILVYSLNLDRPPHPDELHHVMAGQHLLDTGRPIIADGEYWRGILYTCLVAISYAIFGESLSSARLPAVVLVALIAPILFVWIRREAGSLSASITTALFITSPFVVEIAQFCRFYCLQMIFFTLGAICVYYGSMATETRLRRFLFFGLAIVLLGLSVWVQDTTLIGLIGIGVWLVGAAVLRLLQKCSGRQAAWWSFAVVVVATVLLFLCASVISDDLAWAWRRYRTASLFAAGSTDDFWYYHLRYVLYYPTLWPLIGLLGVFAAVRNSRLAWFATTVFGVSFLLTSFAAQKATRYFSYVQPLVFVAWGVGLGVVLPALWRYAEEARSRVAERIALPRTVRTGASRALLVVALAIVVMMNPFWLRSATMIADVAMPMETPLTDWRAARESLAPWTAGAEIMITTEELGAIYFLGRSDVRFSPSKFQELPRDQRFEFGIDPRVGRPIITKPESLEQLVECFDSGFMVGPIEHWGSAILVSDPVQEILRRQATQIEVPKKSHLYAWGWKRAPGKTKPAFCASLTHFSGKRH